MADLVFGNLQMRGSDTAWPEVKFDRLALNSGGGLLFASVLADSGIVKGMRALLNCDKRVTINGSGVKVKRASANEWDNRTPGYINKLDGGYTTLIHRLDYGLVHAYYISRTKGFMAALTDAHLWAALNEPTFTTPLLPGWIGYIKSRLMAKDLLREAECYRCECASLTATTADLDLIVTEGIQDGLISIPRKAVA